MLPSPVCPATRPERFVAGTEPTRPDDTHVALRVDPVLGCLAPDSYPPERAASRIFRRLPPEAELWALEQDIPRPPRAVCPPLSAGGPPPSAGGPSSPSSPSPSVRGPAAPRLLAPAPGAAFALSPGVPPERQRIELLAAAPADTASLTIYLDDAPIATFDRPPYRALWQLRPGRHRARVEARDSRGIIARSEEVIFDVQ
jgi:hypothetical protein